VRPRIRIARVITRLNIGGPALQAILLSETLDRGAFETYLFAGTAGEREGDIRDVRGGPTVRVLPVPLTRELAPLKDMRALVALTRAFRDLRPDIVHTHMTKAGSIGRLAARIAGVPVVVHTFHGNVLTGYFDPLRSAAFRGAERLLASMSDALIAISPRQAAELRALRIGDAKIVTIPLGFDLTPFTHARRGSLRARLRIAEGVPLVGIVARLVPIKAVDVFLQAAAALAVRRPDARFVVVGDGPLSEELRALAHDLGLGGRVDLLGWQADMAAIYADLDCVVLTSRNEGTPVTIIEALAAARPVVATAVGGVPDVVQDRVTGLLAPAGDSAGVARAIRELLDDPLLAGRLAEAGRERVLKVYTERRLVDDIRALYQRLLAARDIIPRS
jgi:glycosyltransferase involved in cell wall biosynthesis